MHTAKPITRALTLLLLAGGFCQAVETPFFEPVKPPRPFQTMVHRGESQQAPENTRAALNRCIEDNLEWAEIDLRLTSDHQHVLSHGGSITGLNHPQLKIKEHALEELQQLDVGSSVAPRYKNERMLSFQQALELAKGKLNLYLDCKDIDPEMLAREILAAGMENQVIVYDDLPNLNRVRAAGQGRVPLMTKWKPGTGPAGWAVTNGLSAVEIDAPEINAARCAEFHKVGIKVEVKVLGEWDLPQFWDQSVDAGVDWFQTDLPEELLTHEVWLKMKSRPVQISLHRGANRYAPENTLPAFDKAIRMGADFIEFDVRTTKDGKLYLLHDSSLDGKTSGKGKISDKTAAEIATLSAGVKFNRTYAQTPLPTLEEFLNDVSGKIGLYFDAKDIAADRLSEALERHNVMEKTVVYAHPGFLSKVKAVNPRIKLLAPLGAPGEIDQLASELKPYAFDTEWDILSEELIRHCHELGIKVFSDALGNHERIEDYQKAIDWGIDLIQTDHPLRILRALELRQKSN